MGYWQNPPRDWAEFRSRMKSRWPRLALALLGLYVFSVVNIFFRTDDGLARALVIGLAIMAIFVAVMALLAVLAMASRPKP